MEQRITSLLLPAPEAELEASCKELDEKVTWLLHNSRKMDNYLELEPFSKDGRLCAHVCDTLKSLPETPTLAAYKDYKAIIILLGMSTTHYAILDELAEQHRKRDEIPELTAYCDALHWMRPGRQYLCNVYNTVCHAFHLLRRNPVRDNRLLVTEKELRHADALPPVRGLPARDTGRTQKLYNLLPVRQHGRGNTLLQGTETAFSEQNHLLQHRLQDRGALPQRQRGSAKGLPAVGNRPDFKVVPAELGVLPVPPNESHLLGQAVFHAWEA